MNQQGQNQLSSKTAETNSQKQQKLQQLQLQQQQQQNTNNNNQKQRKKSQVIVPKDIHEYEISLQKVETINSNKTTLMIRNIPNKYTQDLMLERIDRKFKGFYDFFYLPIDFKNKCNVGNIK